MSTPFVGSDGQPKRLYVRARINALDTCILCGTVVSSDKRRTHTKFHENLDRIDRQLAKITQPSLLEYLASEPPF